LAAPCIAEENSMNPLLKVTLWGLLALAITILMIYLAWGHPSDIPLRPFE
jgi:hypothetical protein